MLKLLFFVAFLLGRGLAVAADVKPTFPSYIGEYAHRQTGKFTVVHFARCKEIDFHPFPSQDAEWIILSECDIDQPMIKSIRIWRTKLETGVGLKIHGEIILPWQKLNLLSNYPYMCNKIEDQEFNVVGYIGLNKGIASKRKSLAFAQILDDGTIKQVTYSVIDSCDFGESDTELND